MMALRLLPWGIWGAMLVFSLATFQGLPAEIPQHVNAAGEATETMTKSWFTWLLLPSITGLTLALLTGLTMALPKRPELFSFPDKERFMRLPDAYRGDVIPRMQQTMDVVALLTVVMLFGVQFALWRIALQRGATMLLPAVLIGSVLFVPVALIMTARVNSAVDAAERKWRAATAGTDSRTSGRR